MPLAPDMLARCRANPPMAAAMLLTLASLALIGAAMFVEHGLGLKPCPLCLLQRIPYYATLALGPLLLAMAWLKAPRFVMILGLLAIAGLMLYGAAVAGYHAGVEWQWWKGPQGCSGEIAPALNAGALLDQMNKTTVVRCDVAPMRILGLSLAGWNVPTSLALLALALWGAFSRARA